MYITRKFTCTLLANSHLYYSQFHMYITHKSTCILLTNPHVYYLKFTCILLSNSHVYYSEIHMYITLKSTCILLTNSHVYYSQIHMYITLPSQDSALYLFPHEIFYIIKIISLRSISHLHTIFFITTFISYHFTLIYLIAS